MITGSRSRQFLAEINVIPLVDVVLVLLVIFMVTAPMLHRGLDINLPTTAANTIKAEERLIVTIQKDRSLSLGNEPNKPGSPEGKITGSQNLQFSSFRLFTRGPNCALWNSGTNHG